MISPANYDRELIIEAVKTHVWYPGLKRPAWEGPGSDNDIALAQTLGKRSYHSKKGEMVE